MVSALARFAVFAAGPDQATAGAPRRDWRASIIGDGMVIVRHRELSKNLEMTERFAAELHLHAG